MERKLVTNFYEYAYKNGKLDYFHIVYVKGEKEALDIEAIDNYLFISAYDRTVDYRRKVSLVERLMKRLEKPEYPSDVNVKIEYVDGFPIKSVTPIVD